MQSSSGRILLPTVMALAVSLALASCTPLEPRARDVVARDGSGVYHVVERGETLWRISKAYGVSVAEIKEANGLRDDLLSVGQRLFVPGATEAIMTEAPAVAEPSSSSGAVSLTWPLAGRTAASVSSGFGRRRDPVNGADAFHKGIDIEAARQERVLAAAGGEVVFASEMSGYGTVVMIDHGVRTITLYAHLSRSVVRLEETVGRGQVVGYVGSDGRTTGPHLHFEVRVKGVPEDPVEHLP